MAQPHPSPLDNHKANLDQNDFSTIDKDDNGQLNLAELTKASEGGNFYCHKQDAVDALKNHLEEFPNASFQSWHSEEFAKEQLHDSKFRLIDADGDEVLSKKELQDAESISGLSKIDKVAAKTLAESPDAEAGVKNWNNTDLEVCDFLKPVEQELEKQAQKIAQLIEGGKNPYDAMMGNYSHFQNMWNNARQLPGDPMRNLESALNEATGENGLKFRVMDPESPYAPKYSYSTRGQAILSVPRNISSDNMRMKNLGSGAINLGEKGQEIRRSPLLPKDGHSA